MVRLASCRFAAAPGLAILVLLGAAAPASAQAVWSSQGPAGGSIRSITPDPGRPARLYAGTDEGIFKSEDAGQSWTASGLPGIRVQAIEIDAAHPGTLYAGTVTPAGVASLGIFKSTDGGASWAAINTGLIDPITDFSPVDVRAISIDPAHPGTLLAGTRFSEIFKSADGGATWQPVTLGGFNISLEVSAFARDPSDPSRVYAASTNGLLLSTDGGDSWTAYGDAGVSFFSLALDPATPSTLFAGNITGYGALKSTDGGAHWNQVNANLPVNTGASGSFWPLVLALAADPSQSSTLYAATYGNGLYRTTDGGTSWEPAGTGIRSVFLAAVALSPGQSSTLYAGTLGAGVFGSTDSGATWSSASAGINESIVSALVSDAATGSLYASTFGGVSVTHDDGRSWQDSSLGLPVAPVAALALRPGAPSALYAGTLGSGLFASTDGGATWSAPAQAPSDTDITALTVDPSNPSTLYAGTGHATDGSLPQRVYKSTDGGVTWTQTSLDAGSPSLAFLAVNPANPQQVVAVSPGASSYFQSLDAGSTWTSVAVASACGGVNAVLFDTAGSATYVAAAAGVCRSSDGGATWTAYAVAASTSAQILMQDPSDPAILYAGTAPSATGGSGGVFRSADAGQSWEPVGTGLSAAVTSLAKDADGKALHAGTSGAGVADLSLVPPGRPSIEPPAGGGRETRRVNPR
jgi:hypothetical protein